MGERAERRLRTPARPIDSDPLPGLLATAMAWLGALACIATAGTFICIYRGVDLGPLLEVLERCLYLFQRFVAIPIVGVALAVAGQVLRSRVQSANTEVATRKEIPAHLVRQDERLARIELLLAQQAARGHEGETREDT